MAKNLNQIKTLLRKYDGEISNWDGLNWLDSFIPPQQQTDHDRVTVSQQF